MIERSLCICKLLTLPYIFAVSENETMHLSQVMN